MPFEALCPDPASWQIALIASEGDRLVLHLDPLRRAVPCPMCGTRSQRVHSRYHRRPWDVPWGRWPVQLVIHARRFFCDALTCPRRIFVESFRRVLARYGVTVQLVLKPPVWSRNKISGLAGIVVEFCRKINYLLRFFPMGVVALLGTAFQQEFVTRNA